MTYVVFGNADAIEGYRDPDSDNPDEVLYRPLPGKRITRIIFPDSWSLQECFNATLLTVPRHFAEGAKPAWVDSDSAGLDMLLREHYGLGDTEIPEKWLDDDAEASQ